MATTTPTTLPATFSLRLDSDDFMEIEEIEFAGSNIETEFTIEIEIGDHQDSVTVNGEFDPDYTEIKDEVSGINLEVRTTDVLDAVIRDLRERAKDGGEGAEGGMTDEQFTAALLALVADRCAKMDLPRNRNSGALLFGVTKDSKGNIGLQRVNPPAKSD